MSPDLKQTLPTNEPQALDETQDEKRLAMSTTLVQPIPSAQKAELARTRYWEERSADSARAKRSPASYAANGNTCVGLGPDDPLVQAVQAVKLQLMQAKAPPKAPEARELSSAKTIVLPTLASLQLPAADTHKPSELDPRVPQDTLDAIELPKRRPRPMLLAAAAVSVMACLAAGYALPSKSKLAHTTLVKPRPQATTTQPDAPPPLSAASVDTTLPAANERAAVDALFAGDYSLATQHYRSLAQTHPDQPAFAEAARILARQASRSE